MPGEREGADWPWGWQSSEGAAVAPFLWVTGRFHRTGRGGAAVGFLTRSGGRGEPSRAPASRGGRRQRDGGAGYPPAEGRGGAGRSEGRPGGGPAGPSLPAELPPSRRARAVCAGPQRQPVRAAGHGAARLGRLLGLGQLESCRRQCGRSVCPPPDQRSAPGDSAAAVGWALRARRLQGPTKWGRGWRGGGRAQAWRRAALR